MKIKSSMISTVTLLISGLALADSRHLENDSALKGVHNSGSSDIQTVQTVPNGNGVETRNGLKSFHGLFVVPGAYSKDGRPLTALSKQADKAGTATWPTEAIPEQLPNPSEKRGIVEPSAESKAAFAAEFTATSFMDAYKASFGGFTRDIYRAATAQEGANGVDPNYDVGANRRAFRSKYDMAHWDEYEVTRNQSQQDALIAKLEEQNRRHSAMRGNLVGTVTGSLFDPIALLGILIAVYLFRQSRNQKVSQ